MKCRYQVNLTIPNLGTVVLAKRSTLAKAEFQAEMVNRAIGEYPSSKGIDCNVVDLLNLPNETD